MKFTLVGGNTWIRINGDKKKAPEVSNKDFAKDGRFLDACEKAGVPATSRQASKYRNKRGRAYNAA